MIRSGGLTVPCFTAAIPSADVHGHTESVHPAASVFLDGLEQVGQFRSVFNLSQKLVQLRMFICNNTF